MEAIHLPTARILDAFDLFTAWWEGVQSLAPADQIESWTSLYTGPWGELAQKQMQSHADDGVDWRQVAREKILPNLGPRLPAMALARTHLLNSVGAVCEDARHRLGLDFDVAFVIYVGLGVGAGWATTFEGMPACLFGLENIAELHWVDRDTLAALCAHELGHLMHEHWRAREGLGTGSGVWWRLYEEGFAMRCEHAVMGRETWHEQTGQAGWLAWCMEHRSQLATELWSRVVRGDDARDFFGSWYDVHGFKQCGYYLGHELVRRIEAGMPLRQVASLPPDEVRRRILEELRSLAGSRHEPL